LWRGSAENTWVRRRRGEKTSARLRDDRVGLVLKEEEEEMRIGSDLRPVRGELFLRLATASGESVRGTAEATLLLLLLCGVTMDETVDMRLS